MNPLQVVFGIGEKLIERIFPDPIKRSEAMLKLKELEQQGDLAAIAGQIEINKIEAASEDRWKSGWRPAVGWVCASALAMTYIIGPLFEWIAALVGHPTQFPDIDSAALYPLLTGMLGFGGLRTYEKIRGKTS